MDILITNIGQIATPLGRLPDETRRSYCLDVTRSADLLVRNGRITHVPYESRSEPIHTVDADGGVLIPGLIDPFWVWPDRPPWLTEDADGALVGLDRVQWAERLLMRAVRHGVTTMEVKCAHTQCDELLAMGHLALQQPRVIGSLMTSLPTQSEERNRLVSSLIGELIPEIRQRRLAAFCDIGWGSHAGSLTEANAVLRAALGAGLRPKIHIETATTGRDAAELALSLGVASVECVTPLAAELALDLARNHVMPVYLPVMRDEQEPRLIDVEPLLTQGLPVALGSGSGWHGRQARSMWSVLASAMNRMNMTLAEAITACTLNNARALEIAHETGSIEEGKRADLVLLDLHDYREIEATPDAPAVSWVMVNGVIAYAP